MDETAFKQRTKELALGVIGLIESLSRTKVVAVIGRQLVRSATSVGANYRAACCGKSTADVLAKLAIVEEEGDKTAYWLELLVTAGIVPESKMAPLLKESNEIIVITVASIKTLRTRK